MRKNLFGKKGEISTQQIIILIILITSFIVVLYFLFGLNFGQESARELCHNSVLTKSQALTPKSTSLQCERTYICITEDGTCEGMTNPEEIEVETRDELYEVLSEEMAVCWWMFGAGKLDYVGDKASKKNYCSICSQIYFDDSLNNLNEVEGEISKDGLYDYMSKNNYSGDQTYAEYILGTNDIQSLKQEIIGGENNPENIGTFGDIDVGEQYYVIMGITSEVGNFYKWFGGAVTGVGVVSLFIPGVNLVTSAIIFGTGAATLTAGGEIAESFEPQIGAIIVKGDGIKNEFMAPTIQKADSDSFKILNCADIETLA